MYPAIHLRPTDLVSHLSEQPTARISAPPQKLTRPRLKIPHILQNPRFITVYFYFRCYTVHVVELLNYYTNHCTYIKFTH